MSIMTETNKAGYPVKNASYWKRQHDKLQVDWAKAKPVLDAAKQTEEMHTKNGVHDESFPCCICEAVRAMEE